MTRVAVLDANVLWPQYLRDALIRAALFDVYQAAWTERILDEMRNSVIRRGRVSPDQIDRTLRFMRENCAHFMVEGYEVLIPIMTNHAKDRHVLAAAVRAGAYTIVTNNTNDFPLRSRQEYGIDLHTPDEFFVELWGTDADRMARMLVDMAGVMRKPPLTVQQLVEKHLGRQAPTFARMALDSGELESALESS